MKATNFNSLVDSKHYENERLVDGKHHEKERLVDGKHHERKRVTYNHYFSTFETSVVYGLVTITKNVEKSNYFWGKIGIDPIKFFSKIYKESRTKTEFEINFFRAFVEILTKGGKTLFIDKTSNLTDNQIKNKIYEELRNVVFREVTDKLAEDFSLDFE